MRLILIFIAGLTLAAGLRMHNQRWAKKLGAFVFILSMGYLGYTLFSHPLGALCVGGVWFLLPLAIIYFKRSKQKYGLTPESISSMTEEDESFFPHVASYRVQLEALGFDAIENYSWRWLDARQHHRFFWNPELSVMTSICLCEKEKIAFTYIIFHSELSCGKFLKTTNYPFSSPLLLPPATACRHVPCEEHVLTKILDEHESLIKKHQTKGKKLMVPDPETILETWTGEYASRSQYNLEMRVIRKVGSEFQYTLVGIIHLWIKAIRDLIRLC